MVLTFSFSWSSVYFGVLPSLHTSTFDFFMHWVIAALTLSFLFWSNSFWRISFRTQGSCFPDGSVLSSGYDGLQTLLMSFLVSFALWLMFEPKKTLGTNAGGRLVAVRRKYAVGGLAFHSEMKAITHGGHVPPGKCWRIHCAMSFNKKFSITRSKLSASKPKKSFCLALATCIRSIWLKLLTIEQYVHIRKSSSYTCTYVSLLLTQSS